MWISPHDYTHLQATGRDARGRKQYKYHPDWRRLRDETKFQSLAAFGENLPRIRRRYRKHLRLGGMCREKVLAAVVSLMDTTLIRIGNAEYARQNKSYGLTTLRNRHAQVDKTRIQFSFRGKSGKSHTVTLQDPRLAKIVRKCQELPGQELFTYIDEDGTPHDVTSQDVNDYLREGAEECYTAKYFRTWHASVLTYAHLLTECPPPDSLTKRKKIITATIAEVAAQLNNTPAVCRSSYVHPDIITAYETGKLVIDKPPPAVRDLTLDERRTLGFLTKKK